MKLVPADETGLSESVIGSYVAFGILPNGQLCGVHRLMYHWTMHLDIGPDGCMEGRYCFKTGAMALVALATWDGEGDPEGWHKHYPTRLCYSFPQIRCRDPESGEVYLDTEISPRHRRRGAAASASASVPSPV